MHISRKCETSAREVRNDAHGVTARKIAAYERPIVPACEQGALPSIATKAELARLKAAARATSLKDRRVNIRLSSGDLSDIQAMALAERCAVSNPDCKPAAQVRDWATGDRAGYGGWKAADTQGDAALWFPDLRRSGVAQNRRAATLWASHALIDRLGQYPSPRVESYSTRHAAHGSITTTPAASNGAASRVATAIRLDAAVAAM